MRRVFEDREQHSLSDDQTAALAELAAAVRGLTEATLLTDAAPDRLRSAAAEVEALRRELTEAVRPAPPAARVAPSGLVEHPAGPVGGPLNPIAPPITVEVDADGTVRSTFTLSVVYEGPPGFVHGGVTAMILDQLSGDAAVANGTPGMTAKLDMRYRKPTPYGVPLTAEAKAVRAVGRRTHVESRITGPQGVTVEATAIFVMPRF